MTLYFILFLVTLSIIVIYLSDPILKPLIFSNIILLIIRVIFFLFRTLVDDESSIAIERFGNYTLPGKLNAFEKLKIRVFSVSNGTHQFQK